MWDVGLPCQSPLQLRHRLTLYLQSPRDKDEETSEEEDDDDDEGSSEDSSEEADKANMTREQRRAAAKAKKEAAIARKAAKAAAPGDLPPNSEEEDSEDDDAPANPNHTASARTQASATPSDPEAAKSKSTPFSQLSRREREAIQAQQAKERYQKLHAEGKTTEAQADLARLAIIKEKREAEAARKKAEKEERDALEQEKRKEVDERERKKREAAMGPSKKGAGKKKA